jgi:hypothetical protein
MQKVALGLGIVSLSLASSCTSDSGHGTIDVCIAVETLATDSGPIVEQPYNLSLKRSGLRTATDDEHLAPPEEFSLCAADHDVQLELVEADGRHVWLSLAATLNDDAALPADLLSNLQNATLEIEHVDEWSIVDHVTISDDDGLVATLHSGAIGAGGGGISVVAESAGLSVPNDCGWSTAQRLRFNDRLVLDAGTTGTLELGDGSVTVVNMYSTLRDSHCVDDFSGVRAVWVAYRN